MKFVFELVKKYFLDLGASSNSSRSLSYVTVIAIIGVAIGVSSLFVFVGAMDGFEDELASTITRAHSHVIVFKQGDLVTRPELIAEKIKEAGGNSIIAISPVFYTEGMIASKESASGVVLEGIETDPNEKAFIGNTTKINERLTSGKLPEKNENGIVLGSALAEKLNVKLGENISLINPIKKDETNAITLVVTGIIRFGMHDFDSKNAYISISTARKFFGVEQDAVNAFKILTKNRNNSDAVVDRIKNEFDYPYLIKNWSSLNRNLFYAIKLEKFVISLILGFIILVASFNTVSTLMLVVHDKRKDLAILRALGLSRKKVAILFLSLGTLIGIAGTLLGSLVGYLLCLILKNTKFVELPPDIYTLSYLPVVVRIDSLLVIVGISFVLCFLATIYPSWYISGMRPVEGLRYE